MRAERRRHGRAIRRARRHRVVVVAITPEVWEFQDRINAMLARFAAGTSFDELAAALRQLGRVPDATRPPRQLLHKGRAPRRGGR